MIIDNGLILVFIIILFIISYVIVFTLGFIIGLFWLNRGVSNDRSLFTKSNKCVTTNSGQNSISIDNTKFVTDIKTEGMEKKYSDIAETKTSEDNISNSIAKLKNMKR